jgi:hypothetical protein
MWGGGEGGGPYHDERGWSRSSHVEANDEKRAQFIETLFIAVTQKVDRASDSDKSDFVDAMSGATDWNLTLGPRDPSLF